METFACSSIEAKGPRPSRAPFRNEGCKCKHCFAKGIPDATQTEYPTMSPHAANSLVHDLVQMAQAMEQLPQVREELRDTQDQLNSALNTVQRLEAKLMDRANEINELNQKVRSAEASRDDAETMFLEADERTSRALDFIKTTFGNAGSLIQALEPAKPEPKSMLEPTIEPVAQPVPFDLEADARAYHAEVEATATQEPVSVQEGPIASSMEVPFASLPTGTTETLEPVPPKADATTQTEPRPYHGLNYFEWPVYVSEAEWLAGGGTSENYWSPRTKAAE